MRLERLVINNFYSYKHAEIDFSSFEPGIIQIQGKNKDTGGSNGSGKSIIAEAATFALFSKTIRKSTEEAMVNVFEGKDCYVELELFQEGVGEVIIKRKKRPTGLEVTVNGESVIKENQAKTQEYLEQLLDIDYKSFCASVVFGQHSDIDFLSASKEDKRLIIKNCLNLDTIFSYRDKIKELKSDSTTKVKASEILLKELDKQLKDLEDKNPNTKKYKFIPIPPLSDIIAAEDKIREYEKLIEKNKRSCETLEKQIHKFEEIVVAGVSKEEKECPICKSVYTKVQTKKDIKEAKKNVESITEEMNKLLAEIKDYNENIKSLTPEINSRLWDKYNEKNKLCENAKIILEQIDSLKLSIKTYGEEKLELDKRLEVLKYWEKAFSEQGLLKYIVKNILDYLNLQVNKYLSILTNNQFSILFDEELSEKIVTNGNEIQYISLSGGEKRKVNLSVMLGLQSIQALLNKNNVNMVIFDEISENIDAEGVQGIFNLLNSFKDDNKLIFLITHNEHLKGLLDSYQTLSIIKTNGISSIKNK